MIQIKCLSLIFTVCDISDSLFDYCWCWPLWLEFLSLIFNVLSSWVLLIVAFQSQPNSGGYSSWTGLSIMLFLVRILIDLIVISLPMKILLVILIFHFPRFFSSPFIITASLILIFTGFYFWLRLSLSLSLFLSLRAAKYSWTHLFQAASLHLCIYLYRFFQLSLTSFSFWESSGNLISPEAPDRWRKRCSENIQQIYKRTCDLKSHFRMGVLL